MAERRNRTEMEGWIAVDGSLRVIEALCRVYDEGDSHSARDIATIIHRLVVDELPLTKRRRELKFQAQELPANDQNLLPQDLVNINRINLRYSPGDAHPQFTVTFLSAAFGETATTTTLRNFNEWWNAPIFIGGASSDQLPGISTDSTHHIAFGKRARLTRKQVVTAFRNKVGAHYDHKVDEEAYSLEDRMLPIEIEADVEGLGVFCNTDTPQSFTFTNSRPQSTVRHLAHELIESARCWDR